jgi:hypothetical protein
MLLIIELSHESQRIELWPGINKQVLEEREESNFKFII